MREKLKHSQKLLEGLATNDFKAIDENADALRRISTVAGWRTLKTPQYELHTNSFRRALEDLQANARKKNLDGAALAYVEMTLTCVKCHKHVREVRIGKAPSGPAVVAE